MVNFDNEREQGKEAEEVKISFLLIWGVRKGDIAW